MATLHETAASAVQARNRISPHIYKTPLIPARSQENSTKPSTGTRIFFKAENFQRTGSFKLRGAMSKLSAFSGSGNKLITASSGNHGIAAACAARTLGRDLTVVLPENVVPAKLQKIKSYGVPVILHGRETGLAEQHAQRLAASGLYSYVSPYNDPDIIAGQGTIALELLEQCEAGVAVDNIFIAMGGGGLISGIGSVMKAFNPRTKIWGVAAENSNALAASIAAGRVAEVEHRDTLADAVAGGIDADSVTLPLAMAVVDETVACNEDEIREAIRVLAFEENMIVEGSAALAFAGLRKVLDLVQGETSVVVLCGANYDRDSLKGVLLDI